MNSHEVAKLSQAPWLLRCSSYCDVVIPPPCDCRPAFPDAAGLPDCMVFESGVNTVADLCSTVVQ